MSLALVLSVVGFGACAVTTTTESMPTTDSTETDTTPQVEKYTVTYATENGTGTAPVGGEYEAGTEITVQANTFVYDGYVFVGWTYDGSVYQAGDTLVMPEENVEFVASWELIPEEPQPSFSQESYEYDKLGGAKLELPLDLDGANLFYVMIEEEYLVAEDYYYDEDKKVLVIAEDAILALANGDYVITVVTDAEVDELTCTVTVMQSLKTTFDEETTKSFVYGKDKGVTFSVGYNGTTPKKLMMGEKVIDAKYYSYDENSFTVSADWLGYFSEPTVFTLYLSNNDVYAFTVSTNVIFATDYDVVTIHNTTANNLGHNPLYQYYDNVSIVDGPEAMGSKVLKITPNTVDVTYDCNGYLTLKSSVWDSLWYEAAFKPGLNYFVSFDYMTEGTSVGEFYYKSASTSYKKELLLGEANDGVVRTFKDVVPYSEIGNGLFIRAFFKNGGGNVYVDNFRIAEISAIPTVSANGEYNLIGDYSFNFNAADLAYTVQIDGKEITANYDEQNKKLIVSAEVMEKLSAGVHTLAIVTAIGNIEASFRVVDNRVATLIDTKANYVASKQQTVKLYGNFTEGLKVTSLKVLDKAYDNGYAGGWDFYHANTKAEYATYATLVGGLNGQGYLEISGELIDKLWGETLFVAEISNGSSLEFSVNNEELLYSSDYDALKMYGILNGNNNNGSPLSSGAWSTSQTVKAREDGKGNAMFVTSTNSSADNTIMTIRMNKHPWEWYTVQGAEGNMYRVTFEYQIKNLEANSVSFFFILPLGLDVPNNFFGQYSEVEQLSDQQRVYYYLNNDGQVHTFDSGWFTYNPIVTNFKIALPNFTEDAQAYFMLDEVKIMEAKGLLNNFTEYQKGQQAEVEFNLNGQTLTSLTVNGQQFAYEQDGDKVVLSKEALNALEAGNNVIKIETNFAVYVTNFAVTDNRVAELAQTNMDVIYGVGGYKLVGEFDTSLKVVAITRTGDDPVWDKATALKTEYITVQEDGLLLSQTLTDMAYRTAKFVVEFDNGKVVEFVLNNNVWYYSNYDEANVFINIAGNSVFCQDRSLYERTEVDGNGMLKYIPSNATLGHSVAAINGGGVDNMVFTMGNSNKTTNIWYTSAFNTMETLFISFDYEVVTGDKQSYYSFNWWPIGGERQSEVLTGKGTYYKVLPMSEISIWAINCPAPNPEAVADTYMLIDNFAVGKLTDNYLTEYSANVAYGGEQVTLKGSFDQTLTATSLKRYGTNFWDNSKIDAVEIGTSYVTLSESGLIISKELASKVYGTEVFWLTLSNGDVVRFTLISNLLFYTDMDSFSIHEASEGNIRSCQDTAMREVINVDGDTKIKYTPSKAVLGHAVNGNADNGIFTFSNTTLNNHWWWEFGLDADKTLIVFFDYEVVVAEGATSYFQFVAHKDAGNQTVNLTGSGSFYIELDPSEVKAWRINCPGGSAEAIANSYMIIDNFGFGYKA